MLLFVMRTVSEWIDVVSELECLFIEFSVEGFDQGLDDDILEMLEKAVNILELHEEE